MDINSKCSFYLEQLKLKKRKGEDNMGIIKDKEKEWQEWERFKSDLLAYFRWQRMIEKMMIDEKNNKKGEKRNGKF
ncbi:MAG TPA: hypothetical protein ENL06_01985 [Candidatus Portnoybacteria bacterium]|nr:hypothetical protein [Candidatus Portnoybacteria bacterium]